MKHLHTYVKQSTTAEITNMQNYPEIRTTQFSEIHQEARKRLSQLRHHQVAPVLVKYNVGNCQQLATALYVMLFNDDSLPPKFILDLEIVDLDSPDDHTFLRSEKFDCIIDPWLGYIILPPKKFYRDNRVNVNQTVFGIARNRGYLGSISDYMRLIKDHENQIRNYLIANDHKIIRESLHIRTTQKFARKCLQPSALCSKPRYKIRKTVSPLDNSTIIDISNIIRNVVGNEFAKDVEQEINNAYVKMLNILEKFIDEFANQLKDDDFDTAQYFCIGIIVGLYNFVHDENYDESNNISTSALAAYSIMITIFNSMELYCKNTTIIDNIKEYLSKNCLVWFQEYYIDLSLT